MDHYIYTVLGNLHQHIHENMMVPMMIKIPEGDGKKRLEWEIYTIM